MKLERHPYFEAWTDPKSGVVSYLLTERVAPIQQSFYFTNPSLSSDEQWLWIYASCPPGEGRTLAAVSLDPDQPAIRHFSGSIFNDASPMVSEDGRGCYFCCRNGVWLQTIEGEARRVVALPASIVRDRPVHRIATHLTLSADGRYFLLDSYIGLNWCVSIADRHTGEVTLLKEFTRCHNHGQFSPVDPKLFTLAQDWWRDMATGQWFHYDQRVWLMDIDGERFEPLQPTQWCKHGWDPCHEWWDAQGQVCLVDYGKGVYRCEPACGAEMAHIWRRPLCHAHCDSSGRYFCADQSPYHWHEHPCEVLFYDSQTRSEVAIASALPQPPIERSLYHIDPHPQFSPRDTTVVYTTTVRGRVDVAITPLAQLIDR